MSNKIFLILILLFVTHANYEDEDYFLNTTKENLISNIGVFSFNVVFIIKIIFSVIFLFLVLFIKLISFIKNIKFSSNNLSLFSFLIIKSPEKEK